MRHIHTGKCKKEFTFYRLFFLLIMLSLLSVLSLQSQERPFAKDKTIFLKENWVLKVDNKKEYASPSYDTSNWQNVTFPFNNKTVDVSRNSFFWLRTTFDAGKFPKDTPLGIYLGMIPNSVKIYLNGDLIGSSGRMPPEQDYYPTPNVPRAYLLAPGSLNSDGKNILAIQCYTKKQVGSFSIPYIGKYNAVKFQRMVSYLLNNRIAFFVSLLSVVVGIYFFFMYIREKEAKENLYIALGVLFVSLYYSNTAFSELPFPFFITLKLQMAPIYVAVYFFAAYIQKLFSVHDKPYIRTGLLIITGGISLALLLAPNVRILDAINEVCFPFVLGPILLYVLFLTFMAVKQKHTYAKVLFVGIAITIILTLWDILRLVLSFNISLKVDYWTSSWGMGVFILCIFLTSANRIIDMNKQIRLREETQREYNNKLNNLIIRLREAGRVINDSIAGLSSSANNVSSISTEQASAVQEMISSMEDSNTLTKGIADKTNRVSKIASETKSNVEEGFTHITDSLEKMEEIRKENSRMISNVEELDIKINDIWDVVNIISTIAEQTRIIAFNAELEASNAGDLGKNFEIVANEIRRLADNTTSSTEEIREQISAIQKASDSLVQVSEGETRKIQEGWHLLQKVNVIFKNILESTESAADSAENIAVSSSQQASAYEQILETLKQISEGVNNLVESTMETSKSINELQKLSENVKTEE